MVRTVVFPREGGSLVTNSRAMWIHGLLDTGGVAKGQQEVGWRACSVHRPSRLLEKSCSSLSIVGHQKRCLMRAAVRLTMGGTPAWRSDLTAGPVDGCTEAQNALAGARLTELGCD